MKTVRFSQVVDMAGKPEVYLLFAEDDPEFEKALKQDRIMTLVERGSSPAFGLVGHEPGQHGQLLLFPKSLKSFADARVVGIKFEMLAEPPSSPARKRPVALSKSASPQIGPSKPVASKPTRKAKPSEPVAKPARAEKPPPHKVIAFPQKPVSPEERRVEKLKEEARRALQALEQGETKMVSRHLLRLLKG